VLLLLYTLCLGIFLSGIVVAQDEEQSAQSFPGAYPDELNFQMDQQGEQNVQSLVGAYPNELNSVINQPESEQALAYPAQPQGTSGTEAVGGYPESITSTSAATAVYSTAPPATQQNVVLSYDIQAAPPTTVYYGGTFIPGNSFTWRLKSPALWILTSRGWSWYATCPVGGWGRHMAYVPYAGVMKLYELYPNGLTVYHNYGMVSPGYKYIWFYADTAGRHTTIFTINDQPSNWVQIDVY